MQTLVSRRSWSNKINHNKLKQAADKDHVIESINCPAYYLVADELTVNFGVSVYNNSTDLNSLIDQRFIRK